MEEVGTDFAALLRKSSVWAARLHHFNYQPAEYLHPTKREQFTGILASDDVWNKRRARPALSVHILATLGQQGDACFDLAHEEWALLLLDTAQLIRLVRHVAATLYSSQITRCIAQNKLSLWKRLLGSEGYKFALHGTRLLPDFNLAETDVEADEALTHAYSWFDTALSPAPAPMLARGRLKLPAGIPQSSVDKKLAQQLIFALLHVLEPRWHSSFAAFRTAPSPR
ncbi:SctK family type III secretion system sorting platform protein [Noviherbaspirillum pedocola]|uniref:SctK family type III secretion system sorting platform protein n=1 Tax=Noviherbaspirillum pedocola TaxID=2801341 RepID=A0A934SQF9_9BURK|nr:SctK family type III secretion system sorting platform protein [Noviherbaspirillum pedocola]MBK4733236.1 SctK family type III secretion system sorting platform protein [Noviherbaspirillum pedocola]